MGDVFECCNCHFVPCGTLVRINHHIAHDMNLALLRCSARRDTACGRRRSDVFQYSLSTGAFGLDDSSRIDRQIFCELVPVKLLVSWSHVVPSMDACR